VELCSKFSQFLFFSCAWKC